MYSELDSLSLPVLILAQFFLSMALVLTGWRFFYGPTTEDRIVALDLLAALVMAKATILVFTSGFLSFLDVALCIAVVSFLATIAFARYLETRKQ